MDAICHRLSLRAELQLPASMTLDRHVPVSAVEIEEFLKSLIRRDPSVFLESLLDPGELNCFSPLSGDYEVAFYLKQLRRDKEEIEKSDEQRIRNRRLAELGRLLEGGEYFCDAAMRERDPLLFEQYIAKYSNKPFHGDSRKPRSLSESLMQSAEEQELQQRLNDALANEIEEEEEGDIEDSEFMRNEFEQIMKERFLCGVDEAYVDYNRIDNDGCLDDDLLKIENQDKEDKYFHSDDE